MSTLAKCVALTVCFVLIVPQVSGHLCPSGWIERKGDPSCYLISGKSGRTTYNGAQAFCKQAKGDLIKIDSMELKAWLFNEISRRIHADSSNTHWWVGLTHQSSPGQWKWTDGTALNTQLHLWRPNEPNNLGGRGENCAEIMTDNYVIGLNDESCSRRYSYVCQTKAEIPLYCDTDTIQGWDSSNKICYKYMDYLRPWADAKASCEGAGGQLASPGDPAVEQLVQTYANRNQRDVWINVKSQPTTNNPKYQFVWSNSSAVSVTFWATGEPKVQQGQENSTCVRVSKTGSGITNWQTDLCDNEHQYVCTKVPGGCAPGWTPFSKWCYEFNYLAMLSWSEANRYCQQQGAILMEITTKDQQNNFLVPFLDDLQQNGIPSIWIGISDSPGKAGAFRWTSGAQLGYKNWAQNFPNNTVSKLDCGVIYTDDNKGMWSTTPNCLQPKGFLCQSNENDVITPVSTPAPSYSCDPGWTLNGQKCYKFYSKHVSWITAQTTCQQQSGRLAYIPDADTQTYINKKVKQDSWTALNDRLQNGQYLFGDNTPVVTFKNWDSKEPSTNKYLNCGLVRGASGHRGKWKMADCSKKYPFFCDKDPSNIPPTTGPTTPAVTWSTNCGPFWDENPVSGYCYMFVDRPLNWKDARDYCKNTDKSYLTSITSVDEQNYIAGRLTSKTYLSYWLGGNDLNSEGGWEWSDGSGFGFMNWGKGQPDNWKKNQDCMRMDMNQFKAWDDSACSTRLPFICKKPGKNARPPPTESTYVEPLCGEGWRINGNNCYEFNQKRTRWIRARKTCIREGGDLAVINDLQTQSFINSNLKIESWVGLNDRFKEKTFIWNNNNKTTNLPYKNWLQGQPDHKKNQDCVSLMTKKTSFGKWRDNKCNGRQGYICQKPASCGKNWYLYGKTCYFFNTSGATWAGARNQCKKMGGDLLTIKTHDIQSFVTGKLLRESWTGLNDQLVNKKYFWLDSKDKVPFFNWAKGQPDNRDNEDCGTIMKTSGNWRDRSCTQQYGFVCEKTSANLFLGCPDGWVSYEGHCYLSGYSPKGVSWQDARTTCQGMSAELVSITRASEQKFVFSRVAHAHSPVWIGLNDLDNFSGHRMFTWTDNSDVLYSNWAKGEPNNHGGNKENCVAMNRDHKGGWDDYSCTVTQRAYMCEKEMQPEALTSPSPMNIGCKSGLGLYTNCYTFVTSKMSFNNAEKYCVSKLKGHLVTISSRYIQAFLASELADREGNWWIGLSNSNPQTYNWTSGQRIAYTNWDVSHTGSEAAGAVTISANKPIGLWKNQLKKATKNPFICESARTGAFTTPLPDKPTPNPTASCPYGYKEYNGYCYRAYHSIGIGRLAWPQARAACQRYGGDLVSFHSKDEQDFVVKNVIRTSPGIYWIGINDIDKEKGFKWSDGSPVDYTNWMPHQPDDHKHHEDCGEYNKNANQWNDDNCNIAKDYICKAIKGAIPNRNILPSQGPIVFCQGKLLRRWRFYNDMCYYVSYRRRSFIDARRLCNVYGGDLVSIHNHDESDFIISQISKLTTDSFWIGLNDIGENGYNWTDGSPVDFINWYQNEPNDLYGQQSCVQMIRDGFWQDNNCGYLKKFICKASNGTGRGTIAPRTTMAPGNCPPGFFGLDSRCYIIKGDNPADRVNWTTALNRCKLMGNGVLFATISNYLEQSFITSNLQTKNYSVWVGMTDQAASNQFVWVDNSKVTYTHWDKGEPNGYHQVFNVYRPYNSARSPNDKENCVEVYGSHYGNRAGYWNDKSCSALRGYVCQAMRSTSNPLPVTSPLPAYCKPGYTAHGNSCYKVDQTLRTFGDAATSCQNDGGNLVSITSEFEQAFIITLLHNTAKVHWIGLSQTKETGLYDWLDKWPMTFSNWAYGEPSRNGQTCVIMLSYSGQWRDFSCTYKSRSICEIHRGTPPPYTTRPPGYCADSTSTMRGDYCYFIDTKSRQSTTVMKSWPEAQFMCSKKGMSLATVRNKADNDFILGLLKQVRFQGIPAWIGLYAKPGGGFKWQDNSAVDFVNWATGEPSNNRTRTSEDCVQMSVAKGHEGTWYDASCFRRALYVCSSLKVIPTRVTRLNILTLTTPLPVITQVSGNPQTPKGPATKVTVKTNQPKKTVKTRPPVTVPTTKSTGKKTVKTPPPNKTFAPTRKPHTFFPQTKSPVVTQRPVVTNAATRSPGYKHYTGTNKTGSGMSGGGIAGICIAVILAAALVTVGVWYFRRRQSSLKLQTTVGFDNALYNKTGDSLDIGGND